MSSINSSAIQQLQLAGRADKAGAAKSAGKASKAGEEARADKMRQAAKEFEAIFARQMFKQMNQTAAAATGADKELAGEFYQDMLSERVADMAADRGELGIARLLERAWGISDGPEKSEGSEKKGKKF